MDPEKPSNPRKHNLTPKPRSNTRKSESKRENTKIDGLNDYQNPNPPITLPLRDPNSGEPVILDEEEPGEAASDEAYDENTINSAEELLGESEQGKLIWFQFPGPLPYFKQPDSRKGKEKVGVSTASEESQNVGLPELPGGYMGKMLVYKSGAVKLKLGETLFDVSPGVNTRMAQDFVAINTAEEHCCQIGEVHKRAVVSLDIASILP